MNQVINTFITGLNNLGQGFWDYAADVFIQASILIVLLLILDLILRKRVRAVFRYCLWMLLFVKLVLPTSFTLPTGIGYWLGDYSPSEVSIAKFMPQTKEAVPMVQTEEAVSMFIDIPQWYVLDTPTMNERLPVGVELESISWQGLVFSGWIVGMLVLLALLVLRFYFVRGLIDNSRPANERSLEMLDECRCQMGIRQSVELRLTGGKLSPAVCGLFKPVILIPSALLKKLSREKLKAVLIHELAHVKRGDAWVNLLQTMLQIVYFYNPLVWLANAMVRRVREQAVDEMVLVTLRPETKSYSNMLIDIAEMAFWKPNFSLRIIGVVESKKALERRINHMLTRPVPKSSKLGSLGLIAIVVIGAILLPMGSNSMAEAANTQENSRENSETKTIVPGVRVGEYTLGMSKDEVLKRLGEPDSIQFRENEVVRRGEEKYTLNNLPKEYIMAFGDLSFFIHDDSAQAIFVRSPLYKINNGLGVGESEKKIKQAFGEDFHLEEVLGKDFFFYKAKGVAFHIDKKKQTVDEIVVYQPEGDSDTPDQQEKSKYTIVPGLRVGDYTLDMSKEDVLKKLGEPDTIQLGDEDVNVVRRGQENYNLDNLPDECILSFGDISFWFEDDSVGAISVRSPLYKLSNGLGVGDSEQKIKQAFGEDFRLEEDHGKDFCCYHAKGLGFEIHKKNQTIVEIVVYHPQGHRNAPDQQGRSPQTIIPGAGVGDYTFGMSKDEVLRKLGEPQDIHYSGEKYTLNNLPRSYFMSYGDISFSITDDTVTGIGVHSPLHKFTNGLGVGDSEEKIKKAFGSNFQLGEHRLKDQLNYEDKGLQFEIRNKDKTVIGIDVYQAENNRGVREDRQGRDRVLESLPHYNPKSTENWQVDLRGRDVSRLDLRKSLDDLLYADFDSRTTWPTADHMPEGFDQERIMELGKNPGLGVRKVHERGITGRGIGIAIVDQPLLTKHQEYANRLRLYEEINVKPGSDASMHGAAVASIALGKTVGVAPEADLYYIGSWTGDWGKGKEGFEWNFAYYAQAVRRILDINKQLPNDHKIRVISMSVGWSSKRKGYDEMTAAVEEAKKAGMLVVCSCIDDVHGFVFDGLSRAPLGDPDDFASYEPGLWLAEGFYRGQRKWNQLWVPMGSRTTAAPNGIDEYVFYRQGGWSWAIPYVAGVYALAAQVDPGITPERFWKLAMKTGRTVGVEHQGRKYELGPIAYPGALIDALEDK